MLGTATPPEICDVRIKIEQEDETGQDSMVLRVCGRRLMGAMVRRDPGRAAIRASLPQSVPRRVLRLAASSEIPHVVVDATTRTARARFGRHSRVTRPSSLVEERRSKDADTLCLSDTVGLFHRCRPLVAFGCPIVGNEECEPRRAW